MSNPQPTPSTTQSVPPEARAASDDELEMLLDDAISPMPPKSVQVVKMRFHFAGKRPPSRVDHDDVMEE